MSDAANGPVHQCTLYMCVEQRMERKTCFSDLFGLCVSHELFSWTSASSHLSTSHQLPSFRILYRFLWHSFMPFVPSFHLLATDKCIQENEKCNVLSAWGRCFGKMLRLFTVHTWLAFGLVSVTFSHHPVPQLASYVVRIALEFYLCVNLFRCFFFARAQ